MAVIVRPGRRRSCACGSRGDNIGAYAREHARRRWPGTTSSRPTRTRPRASTASCSAGRSQEMPNAGGYRVIRNGEQSNGGILPAGRRAAELDAVLRARGRRLGARASVDGLGGQVFNGPMPVPPGQFAVFGDPQGAVFAVWTRAPTTTDAARDLAGAAGRRHPEPPALRGAALPRRRRRRRAGAVRRARLGRLVGRTACSTSTTSTPPRTRCWR